MISYTRICYVYELKWYEYLLIYLFLKQALTKISHHQAHTEEYNAKCYLSAYVHLVSYCESQFVTASVCVVDVKV